MLVRAPAVTPATAHEAALALEEGKIAQVVVGDQDDVTAVPAVTAVRAALRNVLLAPEAERAVAAATPAHLDAGAVEEHLCAPRESR